MKWVYGKLILKQLDYSPSCSTSDSQLIHSFILTDFFYSGGIYKRDLQTRMPNPQVLLVTIYNQ